MRLGYILSGAWSQLWLSTWAGCDHRICSLHRERRWGSSSSSENKTKNFAKDLHKRSFNDLALADSDKIGTKFNYELERDHVSLAKAATNKRDLNHSSVLIRKWNVCVRVKTRVNHKTSGKKPKAIAAASDAVQDKRELSAIVKIWQRRRRPIWPYWTNSPQLIQPTFAFNWHSVRSVLGFLGFLAARNKEQIGWCLKKASRVEMGIFANVCRKLFAVSKVELNKKYVYFRNGIGGI